MAEVIYNTKDECLKAIETVKAIGLDPFDWQLRLEVGGDGPVHR